jgi:thiol-disulfide isomerase/thioredoxin
MRFTRSLFTAAAGVIVTLAAVSTLPAQAKRGAKAAAAKPAIAKSATASRPKINIVDLEGLKKLLKPGSKPLMINFWATWCDPCREEFPDLVKINNLYKGKIDFLTVTLDDIADIETAVPKFLTQMKAEMPTYLLQANGEAAIAAISPDWAGSLPLTMLYKPTGEVAYMRKGPVHIADVKLEIEKLLTPATAGQ